MTKLVLQADNGAVDRNLCILIQHVKSVELRASGKPQGFEGKAV
jgi:hypothetical protein